MKYMLRTVTWRFREEAHALPALRQLRKLRINSPPDFVAAYGELFRDQVRERFAVFWLSACNSILGFEIVSEGLVNSSLAHPREIFRGAIVATACGVILAHNHPSENTEPSSEDIAITRQLADAGRILGIPVHDHIIFAGDSYTSFAERGLIT